MQVYSPMLSSSSTIFLFCRFILLNFHISPNLMILWYHYDIMILLNIHIFPNLMIFLITFLWAARSSSNRGQPGLHFVPCTQVRLLLNLSLTLSINLNHVPRPKVRIKRVKDFTLKTSKFIWLQQQSHWWLIWIPWQLQRPILRGQLPPSPRLDPSHSDHGCQSSLLSYLGQVGFIFEVDKYL